MAAAKKEQLKRIKFNGHEGNQYLAVRMIKMFKPECAQCQSPSGNHPAKWWENCPHEPYFDHQIITHTEPIIEVQEDGTQLVKGDRTWREKIDTERIVQVPMALRIDNGKGVDQARSYGYKLPQELGYAPFCMMRDCWSQDINYDNARWGTYCNEYHLKLVVADQRGKILEFFDAARREDQIQETIV